MIARASGAVMLDADWATFTLAAVTAAAGLRRYWRNSGQASAIKAADEMEKFHTDRSVSIAERLLDYSTCYIGYEKLSGGVEKIKIEPQDFHLALRHHSVRRKEVPGYDPERDIFAKTASEGNYDPQYVFSGREHYIRDVFDRFLGRLERIEALISKKVIAPEDFADHFSYWLKVIGDPKEPQTQFSADKRKTLLDYINRYEFNGVIRLFARYGMDISRPVA
jgi:hypothetical protein